MAQLSAKDYIAKLGLIPHEEGGYFIEIYKSKDQVKPLNPRYGNDIRNAGTSIFYLLEKGNFSAWHILKSDELWHFYDGSSVKIYTITSSGKLITHILGNPSYHASAAFQIVISAGNWFAAELIDKSSFCLVGCTVAPGFDYQDFKLGDRKNLIAQYLQHKDIIEKFSRK